uniref:Uncharacterized protein n=1 Tax=Peronospora matthiolae TaxID=2874970 RepID=A0AAV1TU30_9STRA
MCRVVLLNQTQYVDHQLGAGLPRIPGRGDSRATGRDNSSDVRSRRGGSTAAQLDSAGHRKSPLMEVEEEENALHTIMGIRVFPRASLIA